MGMCKPAVAVSVVFHDPANYSNAGMRDVVAWLRRTARDVQRYRKSGKLGKRFRSACYYGAEARKGK